MNIDQSYTAALALIEDVKDRITTIETEQDARLQLIDRFVTDVLGWSHSDIKTESHLDGSFTDYLLHNSGQPCCVIEAKRTGSVLLSTHNPALSTYKVSGPALKSAKDGIRQAAEYCFSHGTNFGVLTTGLVWIAFNPFPGEGRSYKEGKAIVFPNLEAIRNKDNYATFYDLFSKEGVTAKLFRVHIAKAEGLSVAEFEPLIAANRAEDLRMITRSQLALDLDPIFREFFGAMSGDVDRDMLLECFVETRESRYADAGLEKIIRSISSDIDVITTSTGNQLAKEIQDTVDTGHGEAVLIVGNKGSGKSTFIERFFELVLESSIRSKCLVIRVDLLSSSGDASSIAEWLVQKFRFIIENKLYKNGTPDYDELQGLYWRDYQKWRDGQFRPLYESDKLQFKIKFGEFLNNKIETDTANYIIRLLEDATKNRHLLPCIIFDNTDHYSATFQESVFQFSQFLQRAVPFTFIVMPITDRTIWKLSKSGPFQTYASKMFYLPVPSTKDVLDKRINYLKRKASENKDPRTYFIGKGIKLRVESIIAFAAFLEEMFIREDFVSRRISWLANNDIRRSLALSQRIIVSPVLGINDLVAAYLKQGTAPGSFLDYQKFMHALLFGLYNAFQQEDNAFVVNLFLISAHFPVSPLLKLRIIKLLIDKAGGEDGLGNYISNVQVKQYFEAMGADEVAIGEALRILLEYRLAEPYDASDEELYDSQRIAVTHSGRMHYEMATTDPIYIGEMAFATAIRSTSVVDQLRLLKASKLENEEWGKVGKAFIEYCLEQDVIFSRIPADPIYNGQRQLGDDLSGRWVRKALAAGSTHANEGPSPPETMYPALTGRSHVTAAVIRFSADKGYGFLDAGLETDVFLHQKVLSAADIRHIEQGDVVICDVAPGTKGRLQAITVYSVQPGGESPSGTLKPIVYLRGEVKFYNSGKRYGFIKVEAVPEDVYLSGRVLDICGISNIGEGTQVEVRVDPSASGRGFVASSVRLTT